MSEEKTKEKQKTEKQEVKAKEFVISLRKAKIKGKPDIEKAKHAIALLKKFFKKHYRKSEKEILISNEVNQEVWKNSNNIKNKIQVLAVEKEGKIKIYLKNSKELKAEKETEKTKEKKTKEEKVEEKTKTIAKEPNLTQEEKTEVKK